MISTRKLTEDELNQLLNEAPESETRNLYKFLVKEKLSAFEFFNLYAVDFFCLLENNRPIYVAVLIRNEDDSLNFWTVACVDKSNVISLCKYVKRELIEWMKVYDKIYATLERNAESEKWIKWLGFEIDSGEDDLITFVIKENNNAAIV